MKLRKSALIVLIGLMLFAFAISMAQTPAQGDQKQKTEACCSMETCCSGDSCEMKDGENAKNHANHECCKDSCDMKKHEGKQHDGKSECCNIKNKAKSKSKQKAA